MPRSSSAPSSDAVPREAYDAAAAALTGELAACRARLIAPDADTPLVDAAALLQPARLKAQLDVAAAQAPQVDRRAVVSMWSAWYLAILIPPALAALSARARAPSLRPADVSFSLAAEGHVTGVAFARCETGDGDAFARLTGLVRAHLEPFVAALVAEGASARLIWGNAAPYAHWAAEALSAGDGGAAAMRLLSAPVLADGEANPLYDRLRAVDENGARVMRRRVCCLRYLLPDMPDCGASCPLPEVRGRSAG